MKNIIFLILLGLSFLLNIEILKAQIINETPVDGLYENDGIIERDPTPLPSIRRADIMWQKRVWRVIDFRKKMNQPFYFPVDDHGNWRSFIKIVMDGIEDGDIDAYKITPSDGFTIPVTYNEIKEASTDTARMTLPRLYDPNILYDTIIVSGFKYDDVYQLRIKEDWYFDKQRSQLIKYIIGLCPVMVKEYEGVPRTIPLFWIHYPQARKVLAQTLIYNRFNDAERRTYDEVLIKRMFSSHIYKVSNVFDRTIGEYAKGIDALFEAERIKTELFNFEHELWEF